MTQARFLVQSMGFRCDGSRAICMATRQRASSGLSWRRWVVQAVLAILASFLIFHDNANAQSSYYKIGNYCNSSDPCSVGDPIDVATGAFYVNEQLGRIPGRVPIALSWQFISQDLSNGPLGQGTSLSTDYFVAPAFSSEYYPDLAIGAIELLGPKNTHFVLATDFAGGSTDLVNISDPPMLGARLKFKVPRPSPDLSSTLRFKTGDTFVFDATGALVRIEDSHGNFVTITRNAQGYPLQVSQSSGRSATFAYNAAGKLASVTLPLGRAWQFSYDPSDHLTRVTDPSGAHTDYEWNADPFPENPGSFPSTVRSVRDRRGNVRVTNNYESFAVQSSDQRVTKQTYADGGVLTLLYNNVGAGYDGNTSVTDTRGNVTTRQYNWSSGFGYDVTRLTDPLGRTTLFEYNGVGRLVTGIVDARGRRTAKTWDARGNMLSLTRPTAAGGTAARSAIYDATWNKPTSLTDELSRTTRFTIDGSGNVTGVTDPGGNTTSYTYAVNGDLLSITTPAPLSQTTTFTYTADGDLEKVTDPLGHTTVYTYDAASRRIAIQDAKLKTVQFAYDMLDHVTSVTETLGTTSVLTTLQYDSEGNLLRLTNPNGNSWQWTHDAMNRVIEEKNPLLQSSFYTWDRGGNRISWTDRLKQKREFTYDALNRRTNAVYRKADGSVESTVALRYNATTGLLESVTDSQFGTYSWIYDGIDRVVGETGPNGSLSFTLDALGRRTGLQVSGQTAIAYVYNTGGMVASIAQGASVYEFSYDPLHRLTQRRLPNGVSTGWSFDAAGFVSSIISRHGAATIDSHAYTRDAAGNVTGDANDSGDPVLAGPSTAYGYDADNRLTTIDTIAVAYDANGQLTSDGTRTFTWDVRGRLSGVNAPGTNTRYSYDPFGLRTGKAVDGVTTSYLLDNANVVSETSGGSSINTLHGPVVDQPLSRGGLYFTPDQLGSTTTLTDGSGSVVQQYHYSPFGETAQTTAVNNPFQFTGRENDETGLYYYRARYYSPKWGRFVGQDPSGFEGGTNLYAYVGNNPTNSTDPDGLGEGFFCGWFGVFCEDPVPTACAERVVKKSVERELKKWKNPTANKELEDTMKISEEGKKGVKQQAEAIKKAFTEGLLY